MFLALAVACSSDGVTSTAIPQSADEIKAAGQELIDAWFEATQKRDASGLYALLTQDITDRCTIEQMEQFLSFDLNPSPPPGADVRQVFLDPDNAQKAIMVLEITIQPRPGRESAGADVATLAYPIFLEASRWHMGFSFPFVSLGDACPFVAGFGSQEATASESSTPEAR